MTGDDPPVLRPGFFVREGGGMSIHDSWQDAESNRKAALKVYSALTPEQQTATWRKYMEKVMEEYIEAELLKPSKPNPIWPKSPDYPSLALRKAFDEQIGKP